MRAERLTLVNFCQHRSLDIEFQPGLTAIIGPNGSGKSNILGAMKYAMTGAHPNEGGKDANICQSCPADERSFVKFTFSHGNVRATVQRNLKPASPTTVEVLDENVARGDKAATAWILDLLSTDAQIINDIVIVDQEDIFGFLSQLPAARAASFAKLFHTDVAETAWKAIGVHLAGVQIPQLPVDLAVTERTRDECAARATELTASLVGDTVKSVQDAIYQHKKVVDAWASRCDFVSLAGALRGRQEPLVQQHRAAEAALDNAGLNVQTLQEAADNCKEGAEASRTTLALLEQSQQLVAGKLMQEEGLAKIQRDLSLLPEPGEPPESCDVTNIRTLQMQITECERFVKSFDPATGTTQCPTCFTSVDNLQDSLLRARRRLPDLQKTLEEQQSLYLAHEAFCQRREAYDIDRQRLQAVLATQQQSLATMTVPIVDSTESEETLRARIVEHGEFTKAIATYQDEVVQYTADVARLAGQLHELNTEIERAVTGASNTLVTEGQASIANAAVVRLEARMGNVVTWLRELAEANTKVQHCQQLLDQCAGLAQEIAYKRSWVDKAQRVRAVLHRDAAPKVVAHRNLARLEHGINAQLEMFATDFRISSDVNLSFVSRFNDGRVQPAARLSSGQKVILALGFRLAVNFMYADLGFLALDEPTAYLDDHHIAGFEPVLGRLREFAASRGLQCLMVTHEQCLAPLFDSIVQL